MNLYKAHPWNLGLMTDEKNKTSHPWILRLRRHYLHWTICCCFSFHLVSLIATVYSLSRTVAACILVVPMSVPARHATPLASLVLLCSTTGAQQAVPHLFAGNFTLANFSLSSKWYWQVQVSHVTVSHRCGTLFSIYMQALGHLIHRQNIGLHFYTADAQIYLSCSPANSFTETGSPLKAEGTSKCA